MVSAFLRALKDPFPPARQAGVLAIAATQNLYLLKEVANRLLPPLCAMTMDSEKIVRDQVSYFGIRGKFVTVFQLNLYRLASVFLCGCLQMFFTIRF